MRTGNVVVVAGLLSAPFPALAAEEVGSEGLTFLEMLGYGWEINALLGVLTFLLLFLLFHSLLVTRDQNTVPADLLRRVLDDLAAGDVENAQKKVMAQPCLLSQTVLAGLKQHNHPLERIHAAMEASGRRALGGIRQRINYMSNIGVLAPMLGLLGTVLGLLKAFNVMGTEQLAEGSKPILMTGAVGEAMSTTAVGLLVGIPAMGAYFLCLSRIGRIGDEVEAAAEEIAAALAELHAPDFPSRREQHAHSLTPPSGFVATDDLPINKTAPTQGAGE